MDNLPLWLDKIRHDKESRASFNAWVDEALSVYGERALRVAKDMEQLLGLRYASMELLALRELINVTDQEIEQAQAQVNFGANIVKG